MLAFLISALALALLPRTFAQQPVTLIGTNLPACAQSCQTLIQAQSACVPPPTGQAAVSDSATYSSCFCNSAYLTNLKAGAAQGVCPTCSAGETTTLQSWYQSFCKNGGVAGAAAGGANGNGNGPTTTSTSTSSTSTQTTKAPAAATGAKGAGGVTQDTDPAHQNKSW